MGLPGSTLMDSEALSCVGEGGWVGLVFASARWRIPAPPTLVMIWPRWCSSRSRLAFAERGELCGYGRVRARQGALFRQILRLEHGIPSHDTFSRLFGLLDPASFHTAFERFMAEFSKASALTANEAGIVALDGKTARRSFDRSRDASPLHVVSAWACAPGSSWASARSGEGGNEIDALLDLVAMLDLEGRVVTADAMHCQRRIATALLERRADYVLALKENQPALLADVRLLLDDPQAPPDSRAETIDGDHGRIETRRASVLSDIDYLGREHAFPGLVAVAKIEASRELASRTSSAIRYFLLSRAMPANGCSASCGRTGPSKTACIGCSTSSWTRITPATAATMGRRTSLCCVASP